MSKKVPPRGAYPHTKRVGDFIFVSGTSSRRANNTIAGAEALDNMGTKKIDVAIQTKEVLKNIAKNLENEGATLEDVVDVTSFLVNISVVSQRLKKSWELYFILSEMNPTDKAYRSELLYSLRV